MQHKELQNLHARTLVALTMFIAAPPNRRESRNIPGPYLAKMRTADRNSPTVDHHLRAHACHPEGRASRIRICMPSHAIPGSDTPFQKASEDEIHRVKMPPRSLRTQNVLTVAFEQAGQVPE